MLSTVNFQSISQHLIKNTRVSFDFVQSVDTIKGIPNTLLSLNLEQAFHTIIHNSINENDGNRNIYLNGQSNNSHHAHR